MSKPRLLDLYCGAGGGAMGYSQAGFEVFGVDLEPMPRYPFEQVQADALEYALAHGKEFDMIHASPPCQRYSLGTQRWNPSTYADLLGETEQVLEELGVPYVIENVERAKMRAPSIVLCGIQFGLRVIRHRRFGSSLFLFQLPHTQPHPPRGEFVTVAGHGGNGSNKFSVWAEAMEIDWMNKEELSEAIPPAYTKWIGGQLIRILDFSILKSERRIR